MSNTQYQCILGGIGKMNQFTDEMKKNVDSMSENILLGINENKYLNFSRDFDEGMKNALHEAKYQDENTKIKNEIGHYISKEFISITNIENDVTVVIYKAKFSQEMDDVYVKIVFTEKNGRYYVSGLWFHSLKLFLATI